MKKQRKIFVTGIMAAVARMRKNEGTILSNW